MKPTSFVYPNGYKVNTFEYGPRRYITISTQMRSGFCYMLHTFEVVSESGNTSVEWEPVFGPFRTLHKGEGTPHHLLGTINNELSVWTHLQVDVSGIKDALLAGDLDTVFTILERYLQ